MQIHKAPLRSIGFVVLLCACSPTIKSSGSDLTDQAIVHGKTVDSRKSAAHSVVALVIDSDEGQALCTGSLISEDTVLTAAHCVDRAPSQLTIVFGTHVHDASIARKRQADFYTQHPRWKNPITSGCGDLAIVHFSGGLPDDFHPIQLAPASLKVDRGAESLMLGYGVTDGVNHSGAGVLRETVSTVIGRSSATEVVSDGRRTSVCFGDSGGPALISIGTKTVQWGVASSVTNENCNRESIHTELHDYLTWVRKASTKLRSQSARSADPTRHVAQPTMVSLDGIETDSETPVNQGR